MTDENAKVLADAMNRLAAAIERAVGGSLGGIQVNHSHYHQGPPTTLPPSYYPHYQPNYWPSTTWGVGTSGCATGGNS